MTASCIIVDDEPLAIRLLKSHLERTPEVDLRTSFENPVAALAYLREHPVELVFLDVQMPLLTGMDFARALRNGPAIVFTTAYRDYAAESYELDAVDYLVKPISFARFYEAVHRFLNGRKTTTGSPPPASTETETHRFFNVNKRNVKVRLGNITYVESLKDYVRIHTTTQRLVTKEKIGDFSVSLPENFLRIHRSYVVNLDHVTAYTAQEVEIGATKIPIGVSYKLVAIAKLKQ